MPDRGYPLDGWRTQGAVRVRASWFGIAVAEELWEHEDGRREWRKARGPINKDLA